MAFQSLFNSFSWSNELFENTACKIESFRECRDIWWPVKNFRCYSVSQTLDGHLKTAAVKLLSSHILDSFTETVIEILIAQVEIIFRKMQFNARNLHVAKVTMQNHWRSCAARVVIKLFWMPKSHTEIAQTSFCFPSVHSTQWWGKAWYWPIGRLARCLLQLC